MQVGRFGDHMDQTLISTPDVVVVDVEVAVESQIRVDTPCRTMTVWWNTPCIAAVVAAAARPCNHHRPAGL